MIPIPIPVPLPSPRGRGCGFGQAVSVPCLARPRAVASSASSRAVGVTPSVLRVGRVEDVWVLGGVKHLNEFAEDGVPLREREESIAVETLQARIGGGCQLREAFRQFTHGDVRRRHVPGPPPGAGVMGGSHQCRGHVPDVRPGLQYIETSGIGRHLARQNLWGDRQREGTHHRLAQERCCAHLGDLHAPGSSSPPPRTAPSGGARRQPGARHPGAELLANREAPCSAIEAAPSRPRMRLRTQKAPGCEPRALVVRVVRPAARPRSRRSARPTPARRAGAGARRRCRPARSGTSRSSS